MGNTIMYTGVYSFDTLSYLVSIDEISCPVELLKEVAQAEASWFGAQLLVTQTLQPMPVGLCPKITSLMRSTGRSFEVNHDHPLARYGNYGSDGCLGLPDYVRLDSLWRIQLCMVVGECLKMTDPLAYFRERYEGVFVHSSKAATQQPAFKQLIADVIYRATLPPDVYTVAQWVKDLKKMT